MRELQEYKTLVFDCDGVILDSNKAKTCAFYDCAMPYGQDAADQFVDYHVKNGGISRYKKFRYFLNEIVGSVSDFEAELEALLSQYQTVVRQKLLSCDVNPDLEQLRGLAPGSRWLVASGGDQNELREVFLKRGLAPLFDGGIFGSPDTKELILSREIEGGNVISPTLFIGDSRYDHLAAAGAGLDFVFYSPWTEFHEWREYCDENALPFVDSLSQLAT